MSVAGMLRRRWKGWGHPRLSDRLRAYGPVALSLGLILAIAIGGAVLANRTSRAAAHTRRADREVLSRSIAAGHSAYARWSIAEAARLSGGAPWPAKAGDPATASRLGVLTVASTAFGYGAELIEPAANTVLGSAAVGGFLPPANAPGLVALLDMLRQGQPGLSSVIPAGGHDLLAVGTRVRTPTGFAFFIGFTDAGQTQLQLSSLSLKDTLGRTGIAYVVDGNGVAIAASRAAMVGEKIDVAPFATGLARGGTGFARFRRGGVDMTAAYAPVETTSWHAVIEQSASDLDGPVRGQGGTFTLVVIAALALAAAIAAMLNHQRLAAIRRRYDYKGRMLANTSHELKTPITAIRGATRTLQDLRHTMKTEDVDEFLLIIQRRCDGLERLVGRILLAAGLEAGRAPRLHPEPVDVTATVRRVAADFSGASSRHTISVAVADDLWGRADVEAIDQVLGLLTENAIKYSPGGGDIRIEAEAQQDDVILRVVDPGVGVAENDQPHIFEPFYKGPDGAAGRPLGVGLGLPIAKHLVDEMGGRIGVTSNGNGSSFWFTVPLSPRLERVDLTDVAPSPVSQPAESPL